MAVLSSEDALYPNEESPFMSPLCVATQRSVATGVENSVHVGRVEHE